MATNTGVALPFELIVEIVENIAPGVDRVLDEKAFQTLTACTLISRVFASAARRRLFSTLRVDRDAWQHQREGSTVKKRSKEELSIRVNTLIDLLTDEQSNLALIFRRLDITLDYERILLQEASNLRGLLRILIHRAHNLNALRTHDFGHGLLSWKDLPDQIADCLQTLCRSLPVYRLDFCVLDIPLSIATVEHSPCLRYISLKMSKFLKNKPGSDTSVSTTKDIKVRHSDLLGGLPQDGRYQICYTPGGKTSIINIDADIWSGEDVQQLSQLLSDKSVHISLQYLRCNFYCDFMADGIDFGTLAVLRELAIEHSQDPYLGDKAFTDIITNVVVCLQRGHAKSTLEAIKVTFNVWTAYGVTNALARVEYNALRGLRIDRLLVKYPLIQKVTFCLDITMEGANYSHNDDCLIVKDRIQSKIIDAISSNMPDNIPSGHTSSLRVVQVSVR